MFYVDLQAKYLQKRGALTENIKLENIGRLSFYCTPTLEIG